MTNHHLKWSSFYILWNKYRKRKFFLLHSFMITISSTWRNHFLHDFFFFFKTGGTHPKYFFFFTTPHPHILTIYTYLKLVLFLVRTTVTKSWPLCRLQMSMFDNSNLTTTCFHIKILFFFPFSPHNRFTWCVCFFFLSSQANNCMYCSI